MNTVLDHELQGRRGQAHYYNEIRQFGKHHSIVKFTSAFPPVSEKHLASTPNNRKLRQPRPLSKEQQAAKILAYDALRAKRRSRLLQSKRDRVTNDIAANAKPGNSHYLIFPSPSQAASAPQAIGTHCSLR